MCCGRVRARRWQERGSPIVFFWISSVPPPSDIPRQLSTWYAQYRRPCRRVPTPLRLSRRSRGRSGRNAGLEWFARACRPTDGDGGSLPHDTSRSPVYATARSSRRTASSSRSRADARAPTSALNGSGERPAFDLFPSSVSWPRPSDVRSWPSNATARPHPPLTSSDDYHSAGTRASSRNTSFNSAPHGHLHEWTNRHARLVHREGEHRDPAVFGDIEVGPRRRMPKSAMWACEVHTFCR